MPSPCPDGDAESGSTVSRRAGDGGYALVAAVAAVAVFAAMAFQIIAGGRGSLAIVAARMERAKLEAAADAGLGLAIHALAAADRGARWSIDGRSRELRFDDAELTVTVEDEHGKAPLSALTDGQVRALFAGGGARAEQLDALVAEYRQWVSDPAAVGDDAIPNLPPSDGRRIRKGPMLTVGELALLQDMTPQVFARVAPATTVFPEAVGPFDPRHASALARATMSADDTASADQVANENATDAERPDEDLAETTLVGQVVTIRVLAHNRAGSRASRMEIIEFTGDPRTPYWIRYSE